MHTATTQRAKSVRAPGQCVVCHGTWTLTEHKPRIKAHTIVTNAAHANVLAQLFKENLEGVVHCLGAYLLTRTRKPLCICVCFVGGR